MNWFSGKTLPKTYDKFNCMCTFSFRALIMPVQKENIVFSSIIVSLWQDILVHVLCNYCLRDDGFPVHGHVLHLLLGCFSRCLWMRLKSILYPYIIWTKSWCKKKGINTLTEARVTGQSQCFECICAHADV